MGRRRVTFYLLILLVVAGPAAGDMAVVVAGGGKSSIDAAVRQLMMLPAVASARLEDAVAPDLGVDMELHRRVLANVGLSPLLANKAACIKSCPARGGAYTGRGCQNVFKCH